MRFCLLVAALLCASQGARASLFDDVLQRTQAAQAQAEAAIAGVRDAVVTGAAAAANATIEAVSAAVDVAQKEVGRLVDEAQADGVAAAECGVAAAASFATITTNLPLALTHCVTDRLDAFNYYIQKIEADFADILIAVPTAVHDSAECWVDVLCQGRVYLNLTAFEAKKTADVAFQLVQLEAAKVNVIASVAKCDLETKAQALLDVAMVAPRAAVCVSNLRAAIKAQSQTSS